MSEIMTLADTLASMCIDFKMGGITEGTFRQNLGFIGKKYGTYEENMSPVVLRTMLDNHCTDMPKDKVDNLFEAISDLL